MKNSLFIISIALILYSCSNTKKENVPSTNNTATANTPTDTAGNFFPVTTYLKGEIFVIKNGGVTPLRKITVGTNVDSSWIKMEELEMIFSDFLIPIIDTTNLKNFSVEREIFIISEYFVRT